MTLLDGLTVVDFSRVLAGPSATQMLADLGARVIKIERPEHGDDTRAWGPPWTGDSSSYYFATNRSKESVELDLASAEDRAIAIDLVRSADILVENFITGTMARFGLDFESLSRMNERLIYCSVTGFGGYGGATLPGYDFIVQAVGGLMSITGEPDGKPMKTGVAIVDILTGKDAVIGILAALAERSRSGLGQRVEVNLLSSLLGSLANQAGSYLSTGVAPIRMGNQHPSIAPYETLHCGDGIIAVACGNDRQFSQFVAVLGAEHLAADVRFATNAQRVAHRAELIVDLEAQLAHHSTAHWVERFTSAGVPAATVGDIASAIAYAAELGLEPTIEVLPGMPRQIRHPVTYSRSALRPASPPPALGNHNELVKSRLRYGAGEPE